MLGKLVHSSLLLTGASRPPPVPTGRHLLQHKSVFPRESYSVLSGRWDCKLLAVSSQRVCDNHLPEALFFAIHREDLRPSKVKVLACFSDQLLSLYDPAIPLLGVYPQKL